MTITPETTVAEIATVTPATIRVFQQHHIDYCCGGKVPLGPSYVEARDGADWQFLGHDGKIRTYTEITGE